MVSEHKKIKLFDKTIREFISEYSIIDPSINKTLRYKTYEKIVLFNKEVHENQQDFIACKLTSIVNLTLIKDLGIQTSTSSLDPNIWKYLHNLYFITLDLDSTELLTIMNESKENITKYSAATKPKQPQLPFNPVDLMGMFGGGEMSNIMKTVSEQLTQQLEGKEDPFADIENPMDIFSSIISGQTVGGIDFMSIINSTMSTLTTKVDNRELKIDEVSNTLAIEAPPQLKEE